MIFLRSPTEVCKIFSQEVVTGGSVPKESGTLTCPPAYVRIRLSSGIGAAAGSPPPHTNRKMRGVQQAKLAIGRLRTPVTDRVVSQFNLRVRFAREIPRAAGENAALRNDAEVGLAFAGADCITTENWVSENDCPSEKDWA